MPALVESVSPIKFVRGMGLAMLAMLVAWFGYTLGSPLVAATLVLLAFVVGASGLKPLADTPFYRIVLGSVFALCGLSLGVSGGVGAVPLAFVVLGGILTLYAGHKATQRSLWEPAS